MLRDENAQKRIAALQAMARTRDSGLLADAEKVFLAPGEHPEVIAAAASAIAETAGSKALRLFEAALDSDRAPVRIAAAVELLRAVRPPNQ
ncbi:MAG: HEAT repeat domain-containing protein [Rhodospirillales bacterium]